MLLWEDAQRAMAAAIGKKSSNILVCPKCGGDFFSVEEFKQYRTDYTIGLSQRPPHLQNSPTFYFYRCVCGEVIEPPLTMFNDKVSTIYGKFIAKLKMYLNRNDKIT